MSDNILCEIQLKNERKLILRRPSEEDAKDIIDYLNIIGGESDNLLFGKNECLFTVGQEVEFIKNINGEINTLMILGVIENTIVSVAQIRGNSTKRIVHNSELAISVRKKWWNMGVGSAVIKELLRFAKESGITNVSLGVRAGNNEAIKLYEKFGFEKVGLHKNFFNIDGIYYDEILMDLYI